LFPKETRKKTALFQLVMEGKKNTKPSKKGDRNCGSSTVSMATRRKGGKGGASHVHAKKKGGEGNT